MGKLLLALVAAGILFVPFSTVRAQSKDNAPKIVVVVKVPADQGRGTDGD